MSFWLWLWAALAWALVLPHFREVPSWTKKDLSLRVRGAAEALASVNILGNGMVHSMGRHFGGCAWEDETSLWLPVAPRLFPCFAIVGDDALRKKGNNFGVALGIGMIKLSVLPRTWVRYPELHTACSMNRVVAVWSTPLHSHHTTAVHPPFVLPYLAADYTRNCSPRNGVQHGRLWPLLDNGDDHELGG